MRKIQGLSPQVIDFFLNEANFMFENIGYWMGIPMERATNAIRRILLRELPQMDAQQLNVMIFTRMKQIEAEVKQANNEVANFFYFLCVRNNNYFLFVLELQ